MMKRLRALLRGKPPMRVDPRELFAAEVAEYLRSLSHVTAVTRGPDVFALDLVMSSGAQLRVMALGHAIAWIAGASSRRGAAFG